MFIHHCIFSLKLTSAGRCHLLLVLIQCIEQVLQSDGNSLLYPDWGISTSKLPEYTVELSNIEKGMPNGCHACQRRRPRGGQKTSGGGGVERKRALAPGLRSKPIVFQTQSSTGSLPRCLLPFLFLFLWLFLFLFCLPLLALPFPLPLC